MDEHLVEDSKTAPVKDLHAKFEAVLGTPCRRVLDEIPNSKFSGKDESNTSVNIKGKLQQWEQKLKTPHRKPAQDEGSENTSTSSAVKKLKVRKDLLIEDGDEGTVSRRTSLPAAGAVKSALNKYLQNTKDGSIPLCQVSSPYPSAIKREKFSVPPIAMESIDEDGVDEDDDEVSFKPTRNLVTSQEVEAKDDNKSSCDLPSTHSKSNCDSLKKSPQKSFLCKGVTQSTDSSFQVGLAGLKTTELKADVESKPTDDWVSPAKCRRNKDAQGTPAEQSYVFDEFAVGLKALKSPRRTAFEEAPLSVAASIEIDDEPQRSRFEVGLKALRSPKPKDNLKLVEVPAIQIDEPPNIDRFQVGLKALRSPQKAVNSGLGSQPSLKVAEPQEEKKFFEVGLKALRSPRNIAPKEESATSDDMKDVHAHLEGMKKKLKKIEATQEEKFHEFKEPKVGTIPVKLKHVKSPCKSPTKGMKSLSKSPQKTGNELITDLRKIEIDFGSEKKRLKHVRKEDEIHLKFGVNDQDATPFKEGLAALKKVHKEGTADVKIKKALENEFIKKTDSVAEKNRTENLEKKVADEDTKMVEEIEKKEEKAKVEQKSVTANKAAVSAADKKRAEFAQMKTNRKMSMLSKSSSLDDTIMVDMNESVAEWELENMMEANMGDLDETICLLEGNARKRSQENVSVKGKEGNKTEAPVHKTKEKSENTSDKIEKTSPGKIIKGEDEVDSGLQLLEEGKHDVKEGNVDSEKNIQTGIDEDKGLTNMGQDVAEMESSSDRKRIRSDGSDKSNKDQKISSPAQSKFDEKTNMKISDKSPLKKRPKLVVKEMSDENDEEEMASPRKKIKSPVKKEALPVKKMVSPIKKSTTRAPEYDSSMDWSSEAIAKATASPSANQKKRSSDELDDEDKNVTEIEERKYSPKKKYDENRSVPVFDTKSPVRKRAKMEVVDIHLDSQSVDNKSRLDSPSSAHRRKLHSIGEEYSDATNDIIKRWRKRRQFLNLKGSPSTVAERIGIDEEDGLAEKTENLLPHREDDSMDKVQKYLSGIHGEGNPDGEDNPDAGSRLSSMSGSSLSKRSNRSSTLSHTSTKSREEMDREWEKGIAALEKKLGMFDPICDSIKSGPSKHRFLTGKDDIQEEEGECSDGRKGKGRNIKKTTSGSDVLDFVHEKRSRLIEIQNESIHIESGSDSEAEDSDPSLARIKSRTRPGLSGLARERSPRKGRVEAEVETTGLGGTRRQRRRSRSVGRPVPELGPSSPKSNYPSLAAGRLGLCTPLRISRQTDRWMKDASQDGQQGRHLAGRSQVDVLCTPSRPRAQQNSVYIVDLSCDGLVDSDDSQDEQTYRYSCHVLGYQT